MAHLRRPKDPLGPSSQKLPVPLPALFKPRQEVCRQVLDQAVQHSPTPHFIVNITIWSKETLEAGAEAQW